MSMLPQTAFFYWYSIYSDFKKLTGKIIQEIGIKLLEENSSSTSKAI